MKDGRLIVNASNCHSGGGKIQILGFLKGVSNNIDTLVYVDERLNINFPISEKVKIIKINKYGRFFVGFKIRKLVKPNDKIFYFGNLPPYINFNCNNVLLQLSSRFYVDSISMKGFKLSHIIKIFLEKIYFILFIKNVTQVIVQTSSMKNKLIEFGFKKKISVWGFDDSGNDTNEKFEKQKNTFIYVASILPYKNHKRLVKSWKQLKDDGISPKLFLTLDGNSRLKKWIENYVTENKLNIVFLEDINREALLEIYKTTEYLIFPSIFEAYGLPLIEAKRYNMKIIAADLDYCWDFIEPDYFFNPYSIDSITRSVKRCLKSHKKLDIIYDSKDFFQKILDI